MKGTQPLVIAAFAALLVSAIGARTASADTEGTIRVESASGLVGETVPVDIIADVEPPGLGAWTIDLSYDADVASMTRCQPYQGGVCSTEFGDGVGRVTGATADGLIRNTPLVTFYFECGAEPGTSRLELSVEVFADVADPPQSIDEELIEGQITCLERSPEMTIGSGQANIGATVKVDLSSDVPLPGLRSWGVDFQWDDQVLELVECRPVLGVCNPAFGAGRGRVTGSTGSALVGEATLAELTFRCKDLGTSAVTLEVQNAYALIDAEPIELGLSIEDGSIACREPMSLPPTGSGPTSSPPWPQFALAAFGVAATAAGIAIRRKFPSPSRGGARGGV